MNRVKARLDHFAFWTESSGRRIRSFSVVLYCVDIRFLIIERYNQSISRRIFSLDSSLKLLVTSYDQFRVKVRPGYFRNASIKNILYYWSTSCNLSIHPHVYFTNHCFERINPSQRVFSWNTFKIYPYRKQKFDDSGGQKVGRGRNKRLSGRETSGSLSTGSDNSANLETWSNTRPCNVRPASVNNVARPDLPPPRARKDGACTRTRASINIWAGSPERWTVARAIGTAGYIIHAR